MDRTTGFQAQKSIAICAGAQNVAGTQPRQKLLRGRLNGDPAAMM